jgi:hypothetical protein
MELAFVINEDLLSACALFSKRGQNLEGWDKIKDSLWDSYRSAYEFFLYTKPEKFFAQGDYFAQINKVVTQIPMLLSDCRKSQEFQQLLNETQEYKQWLTNEWNEKQFQIQKELTNILRIDLPSKTYTVQVVSPKVGGGSYLGNQNIFWGHTEDWPNYNLVYLMHEVLHDVIGVGKGDHYAIELATDNELRIRLNKEIELTKDSLQGHEEHIEDLKQLLPVWKNYLKDPNKNIFDFIKNKKN